jgi:HD-like signal output (HDOD) protein
MNNKLLSEILETRELPTLPRVAVRVLDLAKEKDVSFGHIAEAICDDPVLAAKILKMVNSSFYGISQPVKTINHALVLLGLQTIKAVAVGFSLVRGVNARRSETFDYVRFWRQSLYTAVFARALAKLQSSEDCEEAFLAGLLSDLGNTTRFSRPAAEARKSFCAFRRRILTSIMRLWAPLWRSNGTCRRRWWRRSGII